MIDARGFSCPEPVLMIKKAMETKEDSYEMTVDNRASLENVTRFARHSGYVVEYAQADGEYILRMARTNRLPSDSGSASACGADEK